MKKLFAFLILFLGNILLVNAHEISDNFGHQGMMNGSWMWFGWIIWILVAIVLVLLIIWLIKQIQKK
jgi:hypothetical protein